MTWRSEPRRARSPSGDAGFTLIEVVVVMAVLGFALVLLVGYRPPWSKGYDIHNTSAELAAQLRLARSEAIAANQPVALELDLPGRRYRTGTASPRPLPAGMAIELLTVTGEQPRATGGDIRFYPDGSSSGGRIILADGTRRVAIGVDWLTGRVGVADVR